ncbi:tectonin beta-propeller repeat-containing protein [Condylostylus longicornis]|uniref:tectonin beta-propeller repeat-containing protein n=1 Tax=Condylostylus longicornis TaxID=2530218 RepID=UPI00244DB2DF|nr:tectonin beta-propeller repeat-containing protein [Condylostylus longicornis]
MPSTVLYAINNEGRVYTLSTYSSAWREFQYLGFEFKKVSAIHNFMWAIGGDRQVYVHVHGLDVPIRVKEESYENERWFPIEGFSKKLLPTDRYKFSSIDGTTDRNFDKIRLPSMAWQWEGDWQLDLNLDGQSLDHDGWTYALDFPATYQTKKAWNTYVRRRKWVRFRRYVALNSWCAVAPLHKDPTEEPFMDVAVGGKNIPAAPTGTLVVWAVTSHGRVMFRSGVSTTSPEGLRWTAISTQPGNDVVQISVGATGLVWATLANGRALVRSGVSKDRLHGESWLEVKPPGNGLKIIQLSVGTDSVWCVTNDQHVWFRRGVKGEAASISEDAAIGNNWVEMVGNISMVSVAHNDQVLAIGSEDRALYFRSGVSKSDLTGKKWRLIQCPMQMSRTSSTVSLLSRKSGSASSGSKPGSLCKLFKEKAQVEEPQVIEGLNSAPSELPAQQRNKPELWRGVSEYSAGSLTDHKSGIHQPHIRESSQHSSSAPAADVKDISKMHYEIKLKNPRAWSPVRSVGSIVGAEAHPETDLAVFDPENSRDTDVFADDDVSGSQYFTECDIVWIGCSAGAVEIDPLNLPNWFNDHLSSDNQEELKKEWRISILERLKTLSKTVDGLNLKRCQKAIEMSSWIKSGEARAQKPGGTFEECLIELEWVSSTNREQDSGTFTILSPDGFTTKMQFSLSEITCVQTCSEPGSPKIAIHAPRLPTGFSPVKLLFAGELEMEDWLSHLTSVCCQINETLGKPSNDAIWVTSNLGEIFVFDAVGLKSTQFDTENKCYTEKIDLSATETPYYNILHNGMSPGTELEISGFISEDADQIRFDLQSHPNIKFRHKVEKLRVIAMHINPRFNEKSIILNSMENSEWMTELQYKNVVFSPGSSFTLIIRSTIQGYIIEVNNKPFADFKHRMDPEAVTCLYVSGRIKLFNISYRSPRIIIPVRDIFWRQIGGHLKKVYSSKTGVVWGIGSDNTAWYYTGGWGGQFLKGLEACTGKINPMADALNYYIYENQRWNPLSGYTTTGLPTDRHMWSDITGRHKRSKEHTKLLSMHWQWISDWLVDFQTPGGVDRDGWQYAVDFPASYHGTKQFTDYVRRRRWFRKCRLTTTGPWQEIGNSKIVDVSISMSKNEDDSEEVDALLMVWAVATNGDVLIRKGVSPSNPGGYSWEHVSSDPPLISIGSFENNVWAVGQNGSVFYRYGITSDNIQGDAWQVVKSANDLSFKQVAIGIKGVWAVDSKGKLAVRKEINTTFPEGTHWQVLPNIAGDPPHTEGCVGFKCVSVGDEVWATSLSGAICKRSGITKDNPAGAGWHIGIPGQWQHVSVEGYA